MKTTKFNVIGFIAIMIFILPQLTFAQIKSRSKMIVLPTPTPKPVPKEMFFEVKIIGSGEYKCDSPSFTCTWSISRTYSGTLIFNEFMEVPALPFDLTKLQTGTATAIATAKQTKIAPVSNFKWLTIPTSQQELFYDVNVSINDQHKVSWNHTEAKDNVKTQERRTITQTWIGSETGKGVKAGEVTLDRQNRKIKFLIVADSDAKVTFKTEKSWEELNELPTKESVPVPKIEGYLNSEVTLPVFGDTSDLKSVGFEKTFDGIKSDKPLLGRILETQNATITVTYKFR